jgi:hypothetical protein
LDEGLRIQRDQVGLVLVDALLVRGIDSAGFLWRKSEVGKTLAGAHPSGTQDQVVRVDLADRVPIFGEVKFDGSRGVLGFESADLGLADAAEFLERQSASAAVGREIGREWSDAIQEGLGAGVEIKAEGLGFLVVV